MEAATRLTLAIAGRTLFGLDLSGQSNVAGKAFRDGLRGIGSRGPGGLAVPLWLPTPVNVRFRRALVTLDTLVYDIIRRFRDGETGSSGETLLVLLSPYITQRMEEFWPDPERFDPQRFTAANVRGRHRFAWFPFSAGPRVCIGKQFAMLEGQLIMAQVMREFRVNVDSGPLGIKAEGTLHPDRVVNMQLERR